MEIVVVKDNASEEALKGVLQHCWGVSSKMNKDKLFACSDSILELPTYYAYCTAPRSVAMQIETHKKKHGMYVWLQSARPDLKTAVKGEYSRDQEINFVIKLTARGIKDMSHYRMCNKAEAPTRKFMRLLKEKIAEVEPSLAKQMVKMCEYRNGICTEFNCCGFNKTLKGDNNG